MPERPGKVGDGIAESTELRIKRMRHVTSTPKTESL